MAAAFEDESPTNVGINHLRTVDKDSFLLSQASSTTANDAMVLVSAAGIRCIKDELVCHVCLMNNLFSADL